MTDQPTSPRGRPLNTGRTHDLIRAAVASETDDCIPWPFATTPEGYGVATWDLKQAHAHRIVLTLAAGPPPGEGRWEAAHRPVACHNRACINPRHIYWATPKQNNADRWADGTIPLGESHHLTTLSEDQVKAIHSDDRPTETIAAEYGISDTSVRRIRAGETWTHALERRPRLQRIKLSDADVAAIKADTRNQCQIAKAYGVKPSTINKIVNGRRRSEPSRFDHLATGVAA